MFNALPGNVSGAAPKSGQSHATRFRSYPLLFFCTHRSLETLSRRLKDDKPENSYLTRSDRRARSGFPNLRYLCPRAFRPTTKLSAISAHNSGRHLPAAIWEGKYG